MCMCTRKYTLSHDDDDDDDGDVMMVMMMKNLKIIDYFNCQSFPGDLNVLVLYRMRIIDFSTPSIAFH